MWEVREGDCRDLLADMPDESVQTCITSPPYWGLRDYGAEGQLGLEPTPKDYTDAIVSVFREVHRVLRDDGTLWLNLGDSYMGGGGGNYGTGISTASNHGQHLTNVRNRREFIERTGLKAKDLVGIPWRTAMALQTDGWYLRSDIIWHKPNPMPESVTDRPTKAHEYLFLMTKQQKYRYNAEAIREEPPDNAAFRSEGRNRRSVWTVPVRPYPGAHFAVFPPELIEPCVLAGTDSGDTVLDPFAGSGTTGVVALRNNRRFIGIELNPEYVEMSRNRIRDDAPLWNANTEVTM